MSLGARRAVVAAALIAVLATAAACGDKGGEAGAPTPSASSSGPVLESSPQEPGESGEKPKGACEYLDVKAVNAAVGVDFKVVEPAEAENAQVCVMQTTKGSFPDFTLATAATKADKESFQATMMPEDADDVGKLGKAAYKVLLKAGEKSGPVAEIGWLSAKGRIFTIRFTSAEGVKKDDVEKVLDPLIALSKDIEKQVAG
ncbi:hypothetical protein Afil01_48650 [Actinorhabdospora filicis]|uniref:DUF3558 domain-containing protein n=1 Tax=Actinorhabdospora filicis TaxID=1785913 RepID=A0A9W6SPM8_9ACTN|nr:hypothetical protein [Actinorhabdospora filicis]GLZ80058.1 hypothetical protein Afil01_48650 [Actinorhabdospora filicis]